jgi:hypothetical protein
MAGAICYSNPRIETSSRVEAVGGVADQVERCGPASEGVSWDGTSAVLGRTINGHPAGDLTRDDVLDDFTLYWLTNTAVSAARYYWESHINLYNAADVSIPAAVSVFPGENYQAPRSWTERAYHNLIYYNKVAEGGHYAAWEQPQLFSEEVRAGFRPLRKSI